MIAVARAELSRLVVDAHGATVAAIPAWIDDRLTASMERRDQCATDEVIAWIFANSPQRDDDPELCHLTSMISKAARG